MLEKLLELDSKGIIAPDNYSAAEYVSFGYGMLDYCMDFEVTPGFRQKIMEEDEINARQRIVMPVSVEKRLMKLFKTDLRWAIVIQGESVCIDGRCKEIAMEFSGVRGRMPLVFLTDGDAGTLLHEYLHLARDFVYHHYYDEEFEEAFACYAEIVPWQGGISFFKLLKMSRRIKRAERRLADYIGGNAGYAVLRLTKSEIRKINESSNALECFKSFNKLRHRIMQERLAL